MPLATMRELLDHAAEEGYGLAAFNVTNLETFRAVMQAAKKTNSPAIVQVSSSARKYMGDRVLSRMMTGVIEQYPDVPVCFHQDHGSSPQVCESAIDLGCTSVMMDGSLQADGKTPSDFQYNVDVTARTVRIAHSRGVSVEGEIGVLGSLETGMGEPEDGHGAQGKLERDALLTDPDEAAQFVAQTGVDALAVAIGTSHGAYKFTQLPNGDVLALDVIEAIHKRMPNTHLVMHGASTVPHELQSLINEYGGEIAATHGTPIDQIERGIRYGVRKVNIDTDLRMALTGAVRQFLAQEPKSFDIRGILGGAITKMEEVCVERLERFGSAGRARKLKCYSLQTMVRRYNEGEQGS